MARPQATPHALAVARGEAPADLLIRGGRVFAAATREWVDTELAIADGLIVGWGAREAREVIDVTGAALTPGFIDAHMHLESTKLWIDQFVGAALPHGSTAAAIDPHELANVVGLAGIRALSEAAARMPFTFAIYASSCVPASPFESAGASLDHRDLLALLHPAGARTAAGAAEPPGLHGVAEVMNYPGVIAAEPEMLARIRAGGEGPRFRVDGHAPGLRGSRLDAYLAAGVESDHECTDPAEATEKRRKGMWVFLREGSASKNLRALAPSIIAHGPDQAALCTDDREPATLLEAGHINDCARLAVACGISEIDALLLASTQPARYHGLTHLGDLGPGHQADILVFDQLGSWRPRLVLQHGRVVARHGVLEPGVVPASPAPALFYNTVHLARRPAPHELACALMPGQRVQAIGVESHSLTTRRRELTVDAQSLSSGELNFAAVIERHGGDGRVGRGLVSGFGLRRGAIASSVAHDAHNLVVAGASASDMARAVAVLAEHGGGQVAVLDGDVIGLLPLALAGLMSDRPAAEVAAQGRALNAAIRDRLGTAIDEPFMQLSFIALSVIPQLRLTDGGLFNVDAFAHVPVVLSDPASSGPR
jgi:adenine deaminase